MDVAQVHALLLIASHLSGYPIPKDAQPPPVEEVTYEEMAKEACNSDLLSQLSCPILGFFQFPNLVDGNDGKEHIKVLSDNSQHSANAIAVHELTHWLQYHNWANPDSRICPREFLREYQAYFAGFRYEVIYEHKSPPEVIDVPGVECAYTGVSLFAP